MACSLRAVACVLATVGLLVMASGGWIVAKAGLAGLLLERAWLQSQVRGQPVKPWYWADTWPVAKLQIEKIRLEQYVLQGDSGQSLAFAPGLVTVKADDTRGELSVISAHRDTHFRSIDKLQRNDRIQLQVRDGSTRHYSVVETRVADRRNYFWQTPGSGRWLALVTCYPFDAISPQTELRYVVIARESDG